MTRAVELAQIASAGVSEAFKNRIINGGMVIDQRGSASSPINVGSRAYATDRWCAEKANTSGSWTVGQSSVAPAGFTNSLLCTVTTADATLASNDISWVEHHIEGFNIADLGWGTANARACTLSFWARSSLTGTYSVIVASGSSTPTYAANYSIDAANTWEYKTITIPGPTSGGFNITNGSGIKFRFALMAGSSLQQAPGSWGTGDFVGSTSQVNWMATNGNTFYLTGVQFEVGSSATSFEYRPFGTELQLCQRYFWMLTPVTGNTTPFNMHWWANKARMAMPCPVPMSATPAVTATGTAAGFFFSTTDDSTYANMTLSYTYAEQGRFMTSVGIAGTVDNAAGSSTMYIQNSRVFTVSAEL